ncbi:glutamine synthetase 1, mitochondrial-like [Colias croceus]|uniref:glutamine synthetase 1, mitochondrial-like n=1 Tax=Colias crocea TaxID=72248 RepID=UPI001E2817F0|nr:glutamine synthetase 1, mitochondrial-like [Colias croceus]
MKHFVKCLSILQKHNNVLFTPKRHMLKESINHIMSKKVMDRYIRLPVPCNKVLATYCWIDGSGLNMRCKDRILNCTPYCADAAPGWAFDGSSTGQATTANSDTTLKPAAVYKDPFRLEPHVLVLAEVYMGDGSAAKTNHRKFCNDLCEFHKAEEPWFGLEQEYTMLDVDGWGLGWPKGGGFPAVNYEFSYCGVGAKYIAGRDISEAHTKACLYAGCDFEGTNAEVMFACWEWQIGTTIGIKAPDDMWMSRYIMSRVSEDYGVVVTYHPKPMGPKHPGVGMHHNFSTKRMRSDGGYQFIEECIKRLEKNHMKHMKNYQHDEQSNRMRLSGKFETAPFDKFSWGIANRKASIRLGRNIKEKGKGFMEDRRPAGDCDPYLVCGLLMDTCLGSVGSGGGGKGGGKCK